MSDLGEGVGLVQVGSLPTPIARQPPSVLVKSFKIKGSGQHKSSCSLFGQDTRRRERERDLTRRKPPVGGWDGPAMDFLCLIRVISSTNGQT